jgi:hypothetical protein
VGCTGASLLQFCCMILRPQGRVGQGIWAGAALEGPAVAALLCEFVATDDGAYFRNFAQETLGHTPL